MIWHRILRPRKRLSNMPLTDEEKPSVDVLIPCYTEVTHPPTHQPMAYCSSF